MSLLWINQVVGFYISGTLVDNKLNMNWLLERGAEYQYFCSISTMMQVVITKQNVLQ